MLLLTILAGVALILFGVRFLRKGLDRLFGYQLVTWLQRVTGNRLQAFTAGVVVGTVAPSSTTLAMLTVKMLHAGNLGTERMLAVFLGTNIGMTVMVQLLAFKVHAYFGAFLLLGLVGFQFMRNNLCRGIGQCLLAMGFIFLAMNLINGASHEASHNEDLQQLILLLEKYPLILLIASAGIAICLQSSTATIGVGLALLLGGVGNLSMMVPIVLGSNVGVAGTALAAGWSSPQGRRLALVNFILKLAMALVLFLLLAQITALIGATPGYEGRQVANFHTGFNILVALIGLPLLSPLVQMVTRLFVPDTSQQSAVALPHTYLDKHALSSPSMALANALRETLSMADHTKSMLDGFWRAYQSHDVARAVEVRGHDDYLDRQNDAIKEYLRNISEESLSPRDSQLQFSLLNFTSELEAIGDIIDKTLCDHVIRHGEKDAYLPDRERASLAEVFKRVRDRLDTATQVLAFRDPEIAASLIADKENFNDWCREIQHDHYDRLHATASRHAIEASSYFLDMLNAFRRISSHLTSVGYAFQRKQS